MGVVHSMGQVGLGAGGWPEGDHDPGRCSTEMLPLKDCPVIELAQVSRSIWPVPSVALAAAGFVIGIEDAAELSLSANQADHEVLDRCLFEEFLSVGPLSAEQKQPNNVSDCPDPSPAGSGGLLSLHLTEAC
jgi:hypothetical protein